MSADREERACFDVRVHIHGDDREQIFELVKRFVEEARRIAPPEVDVRYSTLKPGKRSLFRPTIVPRPRKGTA